MEHYYVPGAILSVGDTAVNELKGNSLEELIFQWVRKN